MQVIANQPLYYRRSQRDIDRGKKGKNQIEVLVDQMKDELTFIEP